MKYLYAIIFLILTIPVAQSQQERPLYPGTVPNSRGLDDQQTVEVRIDGTWFIHNINIPTLTSFLPEHPNGMAIVLCPGGSYRGVSIDKEGFPVAERLNAAGITVFMLKYRTPSDETEINKTLAPLQDAQQALRLVRQNAAAYHIDPSRIGIMGFSAGGHLAATTATQFQTNAQPEIDDSTSVRPDFAIMLYPVISFEEGLAHEFSMTKLLGPHPPDALRAKYSADLNVSADTPPAFLMHCADDSGVPVGNSIAFYEACIAHGVPAEMHLYPRGGHGFGLNNTSTPDAWIERLLNWLSTL